ARGPGGPGGRARGGIVAGALTRVRGVGGVGPPAGGAPREGEGYGPGGVGGGGGAPDGHAFPVQVLDRRAGGERLDAARHYPDQDEVDWVRLAFRATVLPGFGFATAGLETGATPGDELGAEGEGAVVRERSLVNRWIEVTLE